MRLADIVITAAVVGGLSAPAFAQGGSGQQTATNPPVYQPVANTSSDTDRNWIASGFIGTNFGSSRNNSEISGELFGLEDFSSSSTSASFGGQVAYLGRGVVGGEFLAEFSPRIGTFNNVLFEKSPNVNSYMINAIAVAPFGSVKTVDPYVSGGIGWVTLNGTIFTVTPTLAAAASPVVNIGTESVSGSRFGWDLGGGIMAWSERTWGFRGDVRYYRTTSDTSDVFDLNNIGNGDVFSKVELSGIHFWKANAGVSFRF